MPDSHEDGYAYFQWILSHYNLDKKSRELVEKEMRKCGSGDLPMRIAFNYNARSSAGVRGKTYYWIDSENTPLTSNPVQVVKEIPLQEFTGRLFEVSDRERGVGKVKELVGSRFQVESIGHFILVSSSGQSQSELQGMGQSLQKVLHFFASRYTMPVPPHLITIYMVPTTWELRELAEEIHGIRISEGSIGYSFQEDLSIVGVIPSRLYGTLAHELFHLTVRNDFGDIPPWMDEGMAALYEESQAVGDSIVGKPNWRGEILKRFWDTRPSIEELVQMDWRSFDNAEEDYEAKQQATHHAMARYVILYLQNRGKLIEVYNAFRDRKVEEMHEDPGTDATHLLETILQQPLSEVDKDFMEWFGQLAR
jgi:hypothetical protein